MFTPLNKSPKEFWLLGSRVSKIDMSILLTRASLLHVGCGSPEPPRPSGADRCLAQLRFFSLLPDCLALGSTAVLTSPMLLAQLKR